MPKLTPQSSAKDVEDATTNAARDFRKMMRYSGSGWGSGARRLDLSENLYEAASLGQEPFSGRLSRSDMKAKADSEAKAKAEAKASGLGRCSSQTRFCSSLVLASL